ELLKVECAACGDVREWRADLTIDTECAACARVGAMRPHVVWFGEMPRFLDEAADAIAAADLFVSIGTSGSVYPAAGFVAEARAMGVMTMELNLEPSENASLFTDAHYGQATQTVPAFVEKILSSG
ncbi:MAG: Sir2 family NAD-dependent protein deacetylase, partial [Pseudomonadota bacterium]